MQSYKKKLVTERNRQTDRQRIQRREQWSCSKPHPSQLARLSVDPAHTGGPHMECSQQSETRCHPSFPSSYSITKNTQHFANVIGIEIPNMPNMTRLSQQGCYFAVVVLECFLFILHCDGWPHSFFSIRSKSYPPETENAWLTEPLHVVCIWSYLEKLLCTCLIRSELLRLNPRSCKKR